MDYSQYNGNNNNNNNNGRVDESGGRVKEVAVANKRQMNGWDMVFRFMALALSLSAAVVLGVDKQNTTVAMTLVPTLPPVNIPVTAKWHHLSAFVYFVVANAIACAYAALSLLLAMMIRNEKKGGVAMIIVVLDLIIVALLFSSLGAALSIGLLGYEGNSHVQWKKVCHVFEKFCNQGASAIGLSFVAAMLFFLLVARAMLNLHKRY